MRTANALFAVDCSGGDFSMNENNQRFARFGLRALAITASTVAIVDLIKAQWIPAISCTIAWMILIWVERDLIKKSSDSSQT